MIAGTPRPVGATVDHGLGFPAARARTASPDLLVLHDTAGEGDGAQVHRTLSARGLSIHFVVDRAGVVWQFLDPATHFAAHAGKGNNSRSVGIEFSNSVFDSASTGRFANPALPLTGNEKLHGRPVILDTRRGAKRRVLGHLPPQLVAARSLVRAILDACPTIPRRLPRGDNGKVHSRLVAPGWAGVCGHLHLTDAHVDPAGDLLAELDADLP